MRFARLFASSFCLCLIAAAWPVVAWAQSPFVVTLQGPQAKTLGLKVLEVAGASPASVSHPAQLKLPPSRHQVLAAPVAGLDEVRRELRLSLQRWALESGAKWAMPSVD